MQQFLKPPGRAAGTGVVAPELLLELLVPVDDLAAALDAALGRIALAALARPLKSGRAGRSDRGYAWDTVRSRGCRGYPTTGRDAMAKTPCASAAAGSSA